MKSLTTYINEKRVYNKNTRSKYDYHPETKKELQEILFDIAEDLGRENLNLNNIDVSSITDMSEVFAGFGAVGQLGNINALKSIDISEWDVSNVEFRDNMFKGSKFNGDISKWRFYNGDSTNKMV